MTVKRRVLWIKAIQRLNPYPLNNSAIEDHCERHNDLLTQPHLVRALGRRCQLLARHTTDNVRLVGLG
jgi:hypothetical protein